MKKIIVVLNILIVFQSCGFDLEQKAYNFDNFKGTPLWNLAKAVSKDDADEVTSILKNNKLEIDFKDPEYQQTLLALSIQNKKKNAFFALLKAGANPNKLLGNPANATPFIYGIRNVENCDLFYVDSMLQHGADPNLEIKNPNPKYYFADSHPLLASIGNKYNKGTECLELVQVLVANGADINCCYKYSDADICEGVLAKALIQDCIETLKYFIVEKKISIPDTVIIIGFEKSTQEAYVLRDQLTSKDFKYDDYEIHGQKHDRSKERKTRDEILEYLSKIGK